jgi:hypothetical protein
MAAMTVRLGDRWAILLGKDSVYPAPIAFYLGHELGHIALSHIAADRLIVDFEETNPRGDDEDEEERTADEFALELLTGESRPTVLPAEPLIQSSARELARIAITASETLRIEPGMLAQCFGYSTGDWRTANASLKNIYASRIPVWREVNGIARHELILDDIPEDAAEYLEAVLGQPD